MERFVDYRGYHTHTINTLLLLLHPVLLMLLLLLLLLSLLTLLRYFWHVHLAAEYNYPIYYYN